MTRYPGRTEDTGSFQLTSSQGGWPSQSLYCVIADFTFQLTSSQGGWQCFLHMFIQFQIFQLTSSQGGWLMFFQVHKRIPFFNSHPHKEDDYLLLLVLPVQYFSTHILTRRMTTLSQSPWYTPIFQLTSSQGGWQIVLLMRIEQQLFNSHPHKEDDISPP